MRPLSERRKLKQVLPWINRYRSEGLNQFTLVSKRIHYVSFDHDDLSLLDSFYNGEYHIIGTAFEGSDQTKWITMATTPDAAWNQACRAVNFLMPMFQADDLRIQPEVTVMRIVAQQMKTQQHFQSQYPGLVLPDFKWEPKNELSDMVEYNAFFNGAVVLQRKPTTRM